ncbi:MAG: DUF5606 domain-containing protein [Flavobacteriaceae bacterium]|nr:DUF5606 domain-containing protein [Bacteroidia bacterium]MBT8269693.1 DUF5606 domain-containing protein [Bacteroidia bacterium]NNF75506.1 DUF5606 domain-containing protein [Flavobacteriaceae bacterium]NNK69061.1 DUF5606 domain-containing protein [Flavobacteriaceae bacterium]NNL79167.1 DUF5606 domain-containing protein [Flavobacteriaceae bacterium]
MDLTLDKILAISQKPGLYRLLTQTRSGLLAESLIDGKKISVNIRNNISILSEIAIYTLTEELPLQEVFKKMRDKESGEPTSISHKSSRDELEEYFFSILPDYDEDRVYASDIKKIIQWYNILQSKGLLSALDSEEDQTEEE